MTRPSKASADSVTPDGTLERALTEARVVLELIRELPTLDTLDDAVSRGLDASTRGLGFDGAMITHRGEDAQKGLLVLGAVGLESAVHRTGSILREHTVEWSVAQKATERLSANIDAEPEVTGDPMRERLARAGLVLPMQLGARVVGTLTLTTDPEGWEPPGEDALLLARAMADQLGAAVSSLRMRADLITRLEQLDALGRVAHVLTGVEDSEPTMRLVADEGRRVFDAERAGVFLFHWDEERTECVVALGLSDAYVLELERTAGQLRTTKALLDHKPMFVSRAQGRPGNPLAAAVAAEGFRSVALLPLVFAGETIGSLAFYHDLPREYTSDERRLAVAFADQAALAIGKSRLLDQVSRVKREWQMAFDASGSGLAVTDDEGIIIRANRFVAEMADIPVTSLPGYDLKTVFRAWPGTGQDPLGEARSSGRSVAAMLDSNDGRLLVVTATPLPDGQCIMAIDDLTDVVRLENRFRLVVQTAHDAIVITDADDKIEFANSAAAELFAADTLTLAEQKLNELIPAAGQRDRAVVSEALRYEAECRRSDGTTRQVSVSSAPLLDGEAPAGRVAVMRDVTQEVETVDELRRSEGRFRTLFTAAPVAICTVGGDGRFLSVNRAALSMLGLNELPAGTTLEQFVDPADVEPVRQHLESSLAGEQREFFFRFQRVDGAVREAAVVATPMAHGNSPAVLAIARDITDEQRLRERLIHAEKMASLGQVVSGVAHELNNPIAGINALAQTLLLDGSIDQGAERVLGSIRRECDRAARIISDLLTSSRQQPLKRQEVDLNFIIAETMELEEKAWAGDVEWTLDLAEGLPTVSADPDQLRQVLGNLVVNARQAMADSELRSGCIRTYLAKTGVGCEVTDSGPGIPPDALGKVFEPFYTTKVVGEGTGLGLAISHGIIEAHGGTINATNVQGGGAKFCFELHRHAG
jgi:PAS domain S-box-containing protein